MDYAPGSNYMRVWGTIAVGAATQDNTVAVFDPTSYYVRLLVYTFKAVRNITVCASTVSFVDSVCLLGCSPACVLITCRCKTW